MQMMKYGLYIPLACVVLFSLLDLYTGGPAGWVDQLLTNAPVIGLDCRLLGFSVGLLYPVFLIVLLFLAA